MSHPQSAAGRRRSEPARWLPSAGGYFEPADLLRNPIRQNRKIPSDSAALDYVTCLLRRSGSKDPCGNGESLEIPVKRRDLSPYLSGPPDARFQWAHPFRQHLILRPVDRSRIRPFPRKPETIPAATP